MPGFPLANGLLADPVHQAHQIARVGFDVEFLLLVFQQRFPAAFLRGMVEGGQLVVVVAALVAVLLEAQRQEGDRVEDRLQRLPHRIERLHDAVRFRLHRQRQQPPAVALDPLGLGRRLAHHEKAPVHFVVDLFADGKPQLRRRIVPRQARQRFFAENRRKTGEKSENCAKEAEKRLQMAIFSENGRFFSHFGLRRRRAALRPPVLRLFRTAAGCRAVP